MSGLETAIRTALETSERDNPEVRARIYQSARQALEAGLRKQDITDAEVVAHHRHRLESTIHAIEGEERDRLHPRQRPPEVPVPPVVEMPPAPVHRPDVDDIDSPMISGETRAPDVIMRRGDDSSLDDVHASNTDHLAAAPVGEERLQRGQRAKDMDFRPERAAGRRKPRKFFSRLLVWCVLFAFIGIGAWWAYTSGLLLTAAERDTSVANPPASAMGRDLVYGLRPEYISLDPNGVPAEIVVIEPTGYETHLTVRLGGSEVSCVFRERVNARPGEAIRVAIDAAHVHLFDAEGGRRLTH